MFIISHSNVNFEYFNNRVRSHFYSSHFYLSLNLTFCATTSHLLYKNGWDYWWRFRGRNIPTYDAVITTHLLRTWQPAWWRRSRTPDWVWRRRWPLSLWRTRWWIWGRRRRSRWRWRPPRPPPSPSHLQGGCTPRARQSLEACLLTRKTRKETKFSVRWRRKTGTRCAGIRKSVGETEQSQHGRLKTIKEANTVHPLITYYHFYLICCWLQDRI